MSMNENLEVRMEQLTDVIKGLTNKPYMNSSDVNGLLDNLIQKVEAKNKEGIDKAAVNISESLIDALDNKYSDIKERLGVFEDFIANVEKNVQNPKLESEITRVLNDIEALHSKMNSQEIQTRELVKSFEAVKNSSAQVQVSKLTDEIVSISKSYDGIADVLNKNFEEFLKRLESLSSRDEFQRLRYLIENVDTNQNVLVSVMNVVNEKQEEIKNIIRQTSNTQTIDKVEQIQNMLNQMNRLIIDGATKSDLEIISDKINSINSIISEFKRQLDESNDDDIKNIFQNQLNNILSKLESLKLNQNGEIREDIIRLYTSIADFKENVYNTIEDRLNDVAAALNVQFDKISNSLLGNSIESNENLTNMYNEVQKMNSVITEGMNSKTIELRENLERNNKDNANAIIDSIRGDLNSLMNQFSSLGNNEGLVALAKSIENLKNDIDIDSLSLQVDQIKNALNFEPIKEELSRLNKDEIINQISGKLDLLIDYSKNDIILDKLEKIESNSNLDDIKEALRLLNERIDFAETENKIDSIKQCLDSGILENSQNEIGRIVTELNNLTCGLDSVKNIDGILFDIKKQIEENLMLNQEKINENNELTNDIKDGLKTLYELTKKGFENSLNYESLDSLNQKVDGVIEQFNSLTDTAGFRESFENVCRNIESCKIETKNSISDLNTNTEGILNNINDNLTNSNSKLMSDIEDLGSKIENSINLMLDKIQSQNSQAAPVNEKSLEEIKQKINFLNEFLSGLLQNPMEESIESLRSELTSLGIENLQEIKQHFKNLFDNTHATLSAMETNIIELKNQNIDDTIAGLFNDFQTKINSRISSQEALIENISRRNQEEVVLKLTESLEELKSEYKKLLADIISEADSTQSEMLSSFIKNSLIEVQSEVCNYFKQESELLTSALNDKVELIQKEVSDKMEELLSKNKNDSEEEALSSRIDENREILAKIQEFLINSDLKSNNENISLKADENREILSKIQEFLINSKKESDEKNLPDKIDENREILTKIQEFLINSRANSDEENLSYRIDENREILTQINEFLSNNEIFSSSGAYHQKIEENLNMILSMLSSIKTGFKENSGITELAADIQDMSKEFQSDFEDLRASISNAINDMIEAQTQSKEETDEVIISALNNIKETVSSEQNALDEVVRPFESKMESIVQVLQGYIKKTEEKLNNMESNLNEGLNSSGGKIKEALDTMSAGIDLNTTKIINTFEENNTDLKSALEILNETAQTINEKLKDNDKVNDLEMQMTVKTLSEKVSSLNSKLQEIFEENAANTENTLSSLQSSIENVNFSFNELSKSNYTNLKDSLTTMEEMIDALSSRVNSVIESNNANLEESYSRVDNSITSNVDKITESMNNNRQSILSTMDSIKEEVLSVKTELQNVAQKQEEKNADDKIQTLDDSIRIQNEENKKAILSYLLEDATRLETVKEVLQEEINLSSKAIIEQLKEKIEVLETALDEQGKKATDIPDSQEMSRLMEEAVESVVYDIISKNNDIIKDTLSHSMDVTTKSTVAALNEKFLKIENVLLADNGDDKDTTYTIADVESDIAKLRLSLEKHNKLSNFKEFASRLVELKNINLENAKISRVIGADIMRFDTWLKNTTAKLDALASKIDKSEKIKMDDLKSRLIQSEKNMASPQKIEDTLMSIYKKFRVQETKIEDILAKIENNSSSQTDSFDIKEFIDLFYDNNQKTQNLMTRMDSIEDKMDLIQAKIDHLISACIDD